MGIFVSKGTAGWYQKSRMIAIIAEQVRGTKFGTFASGARNQSDHALPRQKFELLFNILMVAILSDTTTRTGDSNCKDDF